LKRKGCKENTTKAVGPERCPGGFAPGRFIFAMQGFISTSKGANEGCGEKTCLPAGMATR